MSNKERAKEGSRMLARLVDVQTDKLAENKHKGSWSAMTFPELEARLLEEVEELRDELRAHPDEWNAERVRREAADVANFCGFIVDKTWGKS